MDPMEWFAWNLKQWRDELTKTDLDDRKQVERLYRHVKAQQTIRWELMCEWLRKSDGENLPYDSEPWLSSEEPPAQEEATANAAEVVNSMSPDALQRELNKLSSILSDDEVSDVESLPRDNCKRDKLDARDHKSYSDLMSGEESESSWSSSKRSTKRLAKSRSSPQERLKVKAKAHVSAKAKAEFRVREREDREDRPREKRDRDLARKLRRSFSPRRSLSPRRKSPLRVSRVVLGPECFRCGKLGHRFRDCREKFCRKCKLPNYTVHTCPNCRFDELDNNNWSVVRKRPISPRRNDKSPPSIRRRLR
ncbi:uncharacterized protein LOC141532845 [Cotesia typhae]|uniref:uncharacterized protein LOC141532845 n=1 Tax=Cotesia typhae TaxID=2053667 RepID=UPI003D69B130